MRFYLGLLSALLVAVALAPGDALAQNKRYRYETDPVRLGLKEVWQGQLDQATAYFQESIDNEYRIPDAHRGLGEVHLLRAEYPEAEMEFGLANEGAKPIAEAFAGLGLVYLRQERTAEAADEFRKALDADGNLWRAHYGLARIAIESGDLASAEEHLEKGKKKKGIDDGEQFYHHGRALLLVAQGKLEDAEGRALKGLELAPANSDLVITVGEVYEKRGVRPLAIAKFEEIRDNPAIVANKSQIYYRLGVLYEQEQRYREAIQSYGLAVASDSTLADAYLHVGAIFSAARQFGDAVQPYRQYTQLKPDDPEGQRRLAQACIDAKDPSLRLVAIDAAKKSIALDRDSQANLFTLARAAAQVEEETDLALDTYARLDEAEFVGLDYYNLGNLYYREELDEVDRDFDDARLNYETAIDMDSTLTDVYFRLGVIDLVDEDWESAEEYFVLANGVTPDNDQILSYLGQAKMQLQDFEGAASLFERAMRIAPGKPGPIVLLAQARTFQEDFGAAVEIYTQALAIDATNASACGGRGFLLLRDGKYPAAEKDLRCATEGNPGNPRYWAFLGQAVHFQGKLMEARQAYDRSLALDPNNRDAREGKIALDAASGR